MSRQKLNRITVLLLLIGFGLALTVFVTTQPASVDPFADNPQAAKMHDRQLEMIGGKASIMTSDFQSWLGSLWHGRKLAVTLAVLTVGVTFAFRYIASHPDYIVGETVEKSDVPKDL